jgi:hypothetical protein
MVYAVSSVRSVLQSWEISLMKTRRILQFIKFQQNTLVGISEEKCTKDAKL